MIALVTGTPGAGKSYYAVRQAVEALEQGKVVVTNFQMQADWIERVVQHHPRRWLFPWRKTKMIDQRRRLHYEVRDMSELCRVRIEGEGEGRAVAVLDEAHRWLNSRLWSDDGRIEAVEWFTLHRKLGFDVYLITQDPKNLDKQIRDLPEYEIRLKNLKRLRILGLPIIPFNLFLAVWSWSGYRGTMPKPVKREIYRLSWRAKLYDSMGIPGAEGLMPENAILLPPGGPGSGAEDDGATPPSGARDGAPEDEKQRPGTRWGLVGFGAAVALILLIVQQNWGLGSAGLF